MSLLLRYIKQLKPFQNGSVTVSVRNFNGLLFLAEGYKRLGTADKLHFMNIAQASLEECRYYILLAKDIDYINAHTQEILDTSIEEVSRLLNGYCKGITQRHYNKQE